MYGSSGSPPPSRVTSRRGRSVLLRDFRCQRRGLFTARDDFRNCSFTHVLVLLNVGVSFFQSGKLVVFVEIIRELKREKPRSR
jgi:hypothetical protein